MKKSVLAAVLVTCFSSICQAGILNRPANGITARDLATAGGFTVADPEGAAAVFYNPAALTEVEVWAWELGIIGLTTDFSYSRDILLGNGDFEARDEFFPFPYGAVAYRLGDLVFAFGFDAPYGLAADYGDELGFDSQMSFINLVAGVGWELNDYLSLGAAFKAVYGDVQFRMPLMDPTNIMLLGLTKTKADGWGYGWQLGARLKLEPFTIGFVYEPAVKVDIDGDTKFLSAVGINSDNLDAHIYQPERLGVGVGWQAIDKLKLGASYFRTDYGKNNKVGIDYDNLPTNVMALGWDVIDSVHLGAEYEANDKLTLRAGWAWMSKGTPDYSPPSIPDGDGYCVNAGVGYRIAKHTSIDVGVSYYWAENDIPARTQNIAAGDHEMEGWMFGVGICHKF